MNLSKGQKINLSKSGETLGVLRFGTNWGMKQRRRMFGLINTKLAVDLDISAVLLGESGQVIETIYFRNLHTQGVAHSGDDRVGDSNPDIDDNETITIDFSRLNRNIHSVVFVLNSFSGEKFSEVPYASVRIYDGQVNKPSKVHATFKLDTNPEFADAKSIIVGRAYKRKEGWNFEAIGAQTRHQYLPEIIREITQFV